MDIWSVLILLIFVNSLGKYVRIGVHKMDTVFVAYAYVCQAIMGKIVLNLHVQLGSTMIKLHPHVLHHVLLEPMSIYIRVHAWYVILLATNAEINQPYAQAACLLPQILNIL